MQDAAELWSVEPEPAVIEPGVMHVRHDVCAVLGCEAQQREELQTKSEATDEHRPTHLELARCADGAGRGALIGRSGAGGAVHARGEARVRLELACRKRARDCENDDAEHEEHSRWAHTGRARCAGVGGETLPRTETNTGGNDAVSTEQQRPEVRLTPTPTMQAQVA